MTGEQCRTALDATNAYADAVGAEHGLTPADVASLAGRIEAARLEIEERRGKDVGFMELPYDAALIAAVKAKAAELSGWCRNFVTLGIGGSALGNIAAHSAVNHPFHNMLPGGHPARGGAPRIFVLDNVDPALLAGFADLVGGELDKTVFNVITKSGSTAETMSQFLLFLEALAS